MLGEQPAFLRFARQSQPSYKRKPFGRSASGLSAASVPSAGDLLPYHACQFRLMASRWVRLPQARRIPVSEYVALRLPLAGVVVTWFVTGVRISMQTGAQGQIPSMIRPLIPESTVGQCNRRDSDLVGVGAGAGVDAHLGLEGVADRAGFDEADRGLGEDRGLGGRPARWPAAGR